MAIEEVCPNASILGQPLIVSQEFSIEIPDKEADAILSGK